jgi:hypothetical protein
MARDCDLYVLIVGARYGWIIPDLNTSVTEREYAIATSENPAKVLVYVKDLGSTAGRERRTETFLHRVTDFNTGYFRAKPFGTPEELAEQFKTDLASWISERIMQRKLSPAVVFGLPDLDDLRASLRSFVLGVLVLAAGLQISHALGGPAFLPSAVDILNSSVAHAATIYPGIFALLRWCLGAHVAAALMWAVIFVALLPLKRGARARVLAFAPAIFIAALVGILAIGPVFFGISEVLPMLTASIVLALYFGSTVSREIRSLISENWTSTNEQAIAQTIAIRVLLSSLLPNGVLVACLVFLGTDLALQGGQSGLARDFVDGRIMFYPALSSAVILSAGLAVFVVHSGIRVLQATLGWSFLHDELTSHKHDTSSSVSPLSSVRPRIP